MANPLQRIDRPSLEGCEGELQLWRLNTSIATYTEECFSLLSSDEQQRAKHLDNTKHRQRFITTRLALRRLLSQKLACKPETIQFSYNNAARPQLKHPSSTLQFNISHSDNISLIAIADKLLIGVDIEQNNVNIEHLQVAHSVFCKNEIQLLVDKTNSSQRILFYRIWTIKEAVLKLLGTGFSLAPCSFCVDDVFAGSPFIDLPKLGLEASIPTHIQIMELQISPNHSIAIAFSDIKK